MVDLKQFDYSEFHKCEAGEVEEDKELQKNSRLTLLSLFCYQIIMENTSPLHPLTQTEILERLDSYPYSLYADRKSISRTINTILSEFSYIKEGSRGLYVDKFAA